MIPPPRIHRHGDWFIVRDDDVPGGTKRRAIDVLFTDAEEYVYASPAYGYAQIALAHACRDHGKRATVFVAQRNRLHPRTEEARSLGAKIVQVPHGYLTNVQSKARAYCNATGAHMLPFGLDAEPVVQRISEIAASLGGDWPEVWCCAGSGTLSRALQQAWPNARHYAVRIGSVPNAAGATVLVAPEPFERNAREMPPFASCGNYDAKVWQYFSRHASPGALFWNVAA